MQDENRQSRDDDDARDAALSAQEVDRWRERAAAAPDLRMAKVMRVRRAIVSRSYDEDAGLEHSLDDLRDDLTILCDEDDPEGPDTPA